MNDDIQVRTSADLQDAAAHLVMTAKRLASQVERQTTLSRAKCKFYARARRVAHSFLKTARDHQSLANRASEDLFMLRRKLTALFHAHYLLSAGKPSKRLRRIEQDLQKTEVLVATWGTQPDSKD